MARLKALIKYIWWAPKYKNARTSVEPGKPPGVLAMNIYDSKTIEQRKVQKLGASSLIITLPKKWVDVLGIKPGDRVTLKLHPDRIEVLPGKTATGAPETLELELDKDVPTQVGRSLVSCLYIMGVEEAVLKISKRTREIEGMIFDIKSSAQDLIGTDIIEEDENTLIVKVFLDARKLQGDLIAKNYVNMIQKIINFIKTLYVSPSETNPKNLDVLRRDLIRYQHVILRLLRTGTPVLSGSCLVDLTIYLGLALDGLLSIARILRVYNNKNKETIDPKKEVIELLDGLKRFFDYVTPEIEKIDWNRLIAMRSLLDNLTWTSINLLRSDSITEPRDVALVSSIVPILRDLKMYVHALTCISIENSIKSRRGVSG